MKSKETVTSEDLWNIIFTIVFVGVFSLLMYFYGDEAINALVRMPAFHFFILSLATFRLTRLIVADHITEWLRDMFMVCTIQVDTLTGNEYVAYKKPEVGIKCVLGALFNCFWCMGVWTSSIIIMLYVAATRGVSWAWVLILILAIAGVASIAQSLLASFATPRSNGGSGVAAPQTSRSEVCVECDVK